LTALMPNVRRAVQVASVSQYGSPAGAYSVLLMVRPYAHPTARSHPGMAPAGV